MYTVYVVKRKWQSTLRNTLQDFRMVMPRIALARYLHSHSPSVLDVQLPYNDLQQHNYFT